MIKIIIIQSSKNILDQKMSEMVKLNLIKHENYKENWPNIGKNYSIEFIKNF